MMKPSIVVVGSSNTDMVIRADRLPAPGETILGGEFFMNPGGKGANQAVAAARLGGKISLIAKTGKDIFGEQARLLFGKEGIDTSHVFTDPRQPSGTALITIDSKGENCIVVAPGANATLSTADLDQARETLRASAIILMQLEVPLPAIEYVLELTKDLPVTRVLNPAPAPSPATLPDTLLAGISIITPNEKEAEMLTGIAINDSAAAEKAARRLSEKGIPTVVITLGPEGAALWHEGVFSLIPAPAVKAIDTTAAGDTFNGALVTALAEGMDMISAVDFACRAAAISVTRLGAQSSAPYRSELK